MGSTRSHIGVPAWALLGAVACAAMVPLEPNLLEEGALLHFAQRMNEGERLYLDIASFTGPLPSVALAWLFRVFGDELWVARAAVAVLHGVATGSGFALARAAGAGTLAHAAAALMASAPILLFPLFSLYFYATIACQLAFLAAALAGRGIDSPRWAVAAGVAVAAVALSKQTLGIALAISLGLALLLAARPSERARSLAAFALGGVLTAGTVIAYYGLRGELAAVLDSLVWLPLSFSSAYDSPFPSLWPLGTLGPELERERYNYLPHVWSMLRPPGGGESAVVALAQLLYAAPFVVLVLSAVQALRGALPAAALVHAGLLVALAINLFPRADWGHLVVALPTALAQGLVLCASVLRSPRPRFALAASCLLFLAVADATLARSLHARAVAPAWGPRVPLREVNGASDAHGVPRVIRLLRERTEPGEAIFVARAEPLLYFATDTRNPTPYPGILPGAREEQERVIRAALAEVDLVVMSERDAPLYTYYGDELPGVAQDFERYFTVAPEFLEGTAGWLLFYQRGPDRGELAVDLVRAPGRRWLRRQDGAEAGVEAALPRLASRLNRRVLPFVVGPRGGGIDYALRVPDGAVLQADVGLARAAGAEGAVTHAPADMLVRIGESGVGGSSRAELRELARVRVDPPGGPVRPGWIPIELDLAAWAGRDVVVRLEAVPLRQLSGPALAWWGSPRIARRATGAHSGAKH